MKKYNFPILIFIALTLIGCSLERRMHLNPSFAGRVCRACGGRDTILREKTDSFQITVRDTIIESVPDSAAGKLLLECDSLGNVFIRKMDSQNGRVVWLTARLSDNELTISGYKRQELFLLEKVSEYERRLSSRSEKTVTEIEIPVPFLPWWVKWILYPLSVLGGIFILYAGIKWGLPLILKAIRKGTIGV